MKRIYLFVSMALVSIAVFYPYTEDTKLENLILANIEVLAAGELEQGHCIGVGSIDCPLGHDKVEYVMSGYSFE